jgi:hypothetical protein
MAYEDKFSERLEIDIPNEATELVLRVLMKEGELRFRDKLAKMLSDELIEVQNSPTPDADCTFGDGIGYVLHLLKEVDFND